MSKILIIDQKVLSNWTIEDTFSKEECAKLHVIKKITNKKNAEPKEYFQLEEWSIIKYDGFAIHDLKYSDYGIDPESTMYFLSEMIYWENDIYGNFEFIDRFAIQQGKVNIVYGNKEVYDEIVKNTNKIKNIKVELISNKDKIKEIVEMFPQPPF